MVGVVYGMKHVPALQCRDAITKRSPTSYKQGSCTDLNFSATVKPKESQEYRLSIVPFTIIAAITCTCYHAARRCLGAAKEAVLDAEYNFQFQSKNIMSISVNDLDHRLYRGSTLYIQS